MLIEERLAGGISTIRGGYVWGTCTREDTDEPVVPTHVLFAPEGNCIALYWDGSLVQRVREDLWHRGDEEAVLCAARLIMGWEKWTEGDRHEKESQ